MDSTSHQNGIHGTTKGNVEEFKIIKQSIKWRNVILISIIHLLGLYGAYYALFVQSFYRSTVIFHVIYGYFGGFGVTAGAHRLWTHRSYKAKLPLRILLAYAYVCAGMNSLFQWVRDHRVHHRFSETDADPHNARRGLFFSHCGWLFQEKHPEVKRRGKEVDMGDVTSDPVVAFEEKYFLILHPICSILIPLIVPPLFWGETWTGSFLMLSLRWVALLNAVWSVNSFAHIYGYRPYNNKINPAENLLVSFFGLGEGWHNYHHVFPWDYKASEIPYYVNLSTVLIDMFASIGWAYDLKQASTSVIKQTMNNSGDGTHHHGGHIPELCTGNADSEELKKDN